jgi:sulfate transport system permease protein
VLISGNLPFETEVASVFVFGQIETGNVTGASAVSVVLLVLSLALLGLMSALGRRFTPHDPR